MFKKVRLLALVLVFALVLVACGGGTSKKDAASDGSTEGSGKPTPTHKELTVYTAFPESELPYYFSAFEKETGIKVNYVRLSAGEILTRVKAEAKHPNASIMFAGPSDTYIAAAMDGLLTPYESPELVNIPDEYKDPDNNWSPIYVGALSFACNSDWFTENKAEYPKTWADLLRPEFKGQISMAHPSTSGTSYTILATLYQMMGEEGTWDYFEKLNSNVRQYTKAGSAPPQQVGLGEAAIALTFAHDGLKPANEGYPVVVSFPEDGTGFEIGGIAIIKDGPAAELENAKLFIDWALSQRGQDLYIDSHSNRLPVNKDAKTSEGLIPLSDIKIFDYDAVLAGKDRDELLQKFSEKVDNAANLAE